MKKIKLLFLLLFLAASQVIAQKVAEEGQGGNKTTTTTSTTTTNTTNPFNNVQKSSNGLYSIDIPTFLSVDESLNDAASMQFSNPEKEFYLIIIDDDKAALGGKYTLDSYFDFSKGNITSGIQNPKEFPQNLNKINGLNSRQEIITGTFSEFGVYYLLTVAEGPTHFYQILTWTMLDYKGDNEPIMKKMVASFKGK